MLALFTPVDLESYKGFLLSLLNKLSTAASTLLSSYFVESAEPALKLSLLSSLMKNAKVSPG